MMTTPSSLKVLVVGHIRVYGDGLAHLLNRDQRCVVVRAVCGAEEALSAAATIPADIALVEAGMPLGLDLIRALARSHPSLRVVALGVDEEEANVLLHAEAGAAGYVPSGASLDDLVGVLLRIEHDEFPCSPGVAAALLRRVAMLSALADTRLSNGCRDLTQRELEIVDLIAMRLSNKQIAARLGIEPATVKNHVHHILDKLQVHRRHEIVARVQRSRS